MSIEKHIKNINRKYLIGYMLLNYGLFGYLSKLFVLNINDYGGFFQKLIHPTNFIGLLVIPLCLIMEGIISSDLKHQLVFLRLKNALPGCRAFTEIALQDQRIDMKKMEKILHSHIPHDPKEQNSAWYSIYKKHSDKTIVFESHKLFLLTRDLASLTFIFLPATLIAHLIFDTTTKSIWIHMGILLITLILTILACQNYGKRFVANVLAEEISLPVEE